MNTNYFSAVFVVWLSETDGVFLLTNIFINVALFA